MMGFWIHHTCEECGITIGEDEVTSKSDYSPSEAIERLLRSNGGRIDLCGSCEEERGGNDE